MDSPLTPLERELCEALRVLRNGYADAVAGLAYIQTHHGRLSGVGFDRVNDHFFKWVAIPEREGLLAGSHTLSADIAKDRTNG